MVYPGKPSSGCATCKSRKIKCGEEKPACSQCKRTSRTCPGYVDVIFRNQTDSVTRKQQEPKKPKRRTSVAASSASKSEDQIVSIQYSSRKASQISNDLYSQLNQLRVHKSQSSIRPPPWVSIQEQAVNICFKNFDQLYGKYDAHNLLLALAPLYGASSEGSPLRVATHAAALSVVAQLPSKRNLEPEAARTYGKAMRVMALALADPDQAQSNETLLATLLLSWYEAISASGGSMRAWSNHIEGATAIVRLRGSKQFHSPLGLSLFRAIRTEMFINCLNEEKAPVEFPEVGGWLSDTYIGTYDHRDPVTHLMNYAVALPGLREEHKAIMMQVRTPSTIASMSVLVQKCRALESRLSESDLPDIWRPHTVGYIAQEPKNIETANAWVGPVHGYPDIYAASALNKLRTCRMLVAKLIIRGLMWAHPDDFFLQPDYHHAVYVEQQAVDDVCSSVPSHFRWGRQVKPVEGGIEEIHHTANLIAGYLLHWPLRVARRSVTISATQRAWVCHRLEEVAERCGVHQASA